MMITVPEGLVWLISLWVVVSIANDAVEMYLKWLTDKHDRLLARSIRSQMKENKHDQ